MGWFGVIIASHHCCRWSGGPVVALGIEYAEAGAQSNPGVAEQPAGAARLLNALEWAVVKWGLNQCPSLPIAFSASGAPVQGEGCCRCGNQRVLSSAGATAGAFRQEPYLLTQGVLSV